jgi:hypothetical protein
MSAAAKPLRRVRRKNSRRASVRRKGTGRVRFTRSALLRALKRIPSWMRYVGLAVALLAIGVLINGLYQVIRKPTEVFTPMASTWNKSPAQTWHEYGSQFRKDSTGTITPQLLAALAQMEGSGNPVAHTYWRWSWSFNPLHLYRPASTSVGMYQITDGTFDQAKHYCIVDHQVRTEGAWSDFDSCWFNALYFRVFPGHAIELTSAYLDVSVNEILDRHHRTGATLAQKQRVAAMVHLCGAGAADAYVRRGFQTSGGQRCGDHDPAAYIARVRHLQDEFAALSVNPAS